jgi:hypothetical protein
MRFGESDKYAPLIVLRCGKGECFIGPQAGFTLPSLPTGTATPPGVNQQSTIRLWSDNQRLALDENGVLRPKIPAVIIPITGIEKKHRKNGDFNNVFVPMAWVWLDNVPTNSKYDHDANNWGYGFKQHWNLVSVGYDTSAKVWMAQIQAVSDDFKDAAGLAHTLPVGNTDHQVDMPGTSRFAWSANDDGLWMPCDQGCCRVSAFVSQ